MRRLMTSGLCALALVVGMCVSGIPSATTNAAAAAQANYSFIVPDGTMLETRLDTRLRTSRAQDGDRFRMTVTSPGQYQGAVIDGYVSHPQRSGRVTGRSEMTLIFDRIRLRNGRTYNFAGTIESARTPGGEVVEIDREGGVREDSQTGRTVERTAVGTAVGAVIGAIAGGGSGAATGAIAGGAIGAGSVLVQGRRDLDLRAGSRLTVRASAP